MLLVDQETVVRLLPMDECIRVVAEAFESLGRGEAVQPLRSVMWLPDRSGALGMMPGYLGDPAVLGMKVIAVFPGNEGSELDSHQGMVVLFDPDDGQPLALIDATEITAVRTAAASGVATDVLARHDAARLALLGSGTQARAHLEAMTVVRDVAEVKIWSRTRRHAERFVDEHRHRIPARMEVSESPQEAVRDAEIVCTTTSAENPILEGAWLAAGCHVNAAGSSVPFARELDGEAVRRSRLFVDRRESTLAEAGDFLLAAEEGLVDPDHIVAEIGEVLAGIDPGRTTEDEITLFESTGLAVEDLAAARLVYDRAREEDAGSEVYLGGRRRKSK